MLFGVVLFLASIICGRCVAVAFFVLLSFSLFTLRVHWNRTIYLFALTHKKRAINKVEQAVEHENPNKWMAIVELEFIKCSKASLWNRKSISLKVKKATITTAAGAQCGSNKTNTKRNNKVLELKGEQQRKNWNKIENEIELINNNK